MGKGKPSKRKRGTMSRRRLPASLLAVLDADERAAAEWLMPDSMLSLLARVPADDARAEVRRFMDGMARRGYDMADLADCFTEANG